jgi:hypothetical protein
MSSNQVSIKISGNEKAVLEIAKELEAIYPLFLEGKPRPNDNGEGIHLFLTVSVKGE